jgi:biopolymer transport protein ExbD
MKLAAAKKVHYDSGPNMTPLVDIVMVILIFLMLTGTFAVGRYYLKSEVPVTKEGQNSTPTNDRPPMEETSVRVEMAVGQRKVGNPPNYEKDAEGNDIIKMVVAIDGQAANEYDSVALLTSTLEKTYRARKQLAEQTGKEKVMLLIRPGRAMRYEIVMNAYQAAAAAGFSHIAVGTQ